MRCCVRAFANLVIIVYRFNDGFAFGDFLGDGVWQGSWFHHFLLNCRLSEFVFCFLLNKDALYMLLGAEAHRVRGSEAVLCF